MIGGMRNVRAGDPVRRSASAHNSMLRVAELANRAGDWGTVDGKSERPGGQVVVKAGASDLARWVPFALGTAITTPGTDGAFLRLPAFNAAAVTEGGAFGIMSTPAAANECGIGLLAGMIPAQVDISSADHKFAAIDSSLELVSAASGYARILYAAGTSGSQWCLLMLGAGGGAVAALDDIGDVTITTAASGDLLKWNGSAWVNIAPTQITVVTDWRLDKTNHKFQVKTRTGYVLSPGSESAWTDVSDDNGGTLDAGVAV